MTIHPVILCGGGGTRLWPLSRMLYPKQLLQFEDEDPLLLLTAKRVQSAAFAAPLVICNEEHRFLVAALFRRASINTAGIVLEAEGRNTAPAAAVAALCVLRDAREEEDPLLLLLHSDHIIPDVAGFRDSVQKAVGAAQAGRIVTFGIRPSRAETGYGYIEVGKTVEDDAAVLDVRRFVEKPDLPTAKRYVEDGKHYWNAGIFLCSARTLLEELRDLAPDVLAAARAALSEAQQDGDFLRLDPEAYGKSPAISIDHAVMERTSRTSVLPVIFEWSDIGSWQEIWDRSQKDTAQNAAIGDAILQETSGSLAYSAGEALTVVAGLNDVVVVNTDDVVLVTRRDGGTAIKAVIERLAEEGRSEHLSHTTVYRPWGSSKALAYGPQFQVKELNIDAGAAVSLQYHAHRSEHWIVVDGIAEVTRDDAVFDLKPNQSTFVAPGQKHRLANRGPGNLKVIEVRCGGGLDEDDVVRMEDEC